MNNKLRQKILKELNYLLSEAEASATGGMIGQFESEIMQKIVQADIDNDDGFNYINLTDFGKMVNEGSLVKFINVYKDADINELDADETQAIKKVCTTNIILVDEFGSTDPYFFVKCQNGKPFKALRIGYEGNEANFAPIIQKYRTGAEVAPPTPGPSPQPKPDTGGGGTAFGKSFQCKPGAVAKFQKWLNTKGQKIIVDDKFGEKTFAAAKAVGNTNLDFSMYNSLEDFKDQTKRNQLCTNIENDSRWNQMTESKNFYDNKKLLEAKLLYNKLTKKLV